MSACDSARHSAVAQWNAATSGSPNARRVDERAIPRGVPVSVNVRSALHRCILRRLERIDRSHLPIADYVLLYPVIAVLQERQIIGCLKGDAMPAVQS